MSESNAPYGVSYIASAPEELKVGDRVEVINPHSDGTMVNMDGKQGTITLCLDDGRYRVDFGDTCFDYLRWYLRKLPDTIHFDNPMDKQVGGSHYKDMAIQPIEFSMKNGLNACQHSIIKYVCRYKNKNGKQDLLKARHFIDMLIEMEYPDDVDFENVD